MGDSLRIDSIASGSSAFRAWRRLRQQFDSCAGGTIIHLREREQGARSLRLDGSPGQVNRAGLPAQRGVHPHPVGAVQERAPGAGAARHARAGRSGPSRRETGPSIRRIGAQGVAAHAGERPELDLFPFGVPEEPGRPASPLRLDPVLADGPAPKHP